MSASHETKVWTHRLEGQYSFIKCCADPSDPYSQRMETFQTFTNELISSLQHGDGWGECLVRDGKLNKIYDDLPCFHKYNEFREWVKDGVLKHPQRRTPKQHQWLCIIGFLVSDPSCDVVHIVDHAAEYCLSLSTWSKSAYAIENLIVDPDTQYYFRNHHKIKDAGERGTELGESCLICANDFDTELRSPQRAPCGHHQCRQCFQKSLTYANAEYTCAFCRACLVCGTNSCKHHVIPCEDALPHPLPDLLQQGHYLCHGRCVATEPLSGLAPKHYWSLREDTRKHRVKLTRVYWLLSKELAPEHRLRVQEELRDLQKLLQCRAGLAHMQQKDDEETERRAALGAIHLSGTL